MTAERRLVFLEPAAQTFAQAALDLLSTEHHRIGLVGSGPLAAEFASQARQRGVAFEAFPSGVPDSEAGLDTFVLVETSAPELGALLMAFVDRDAFVIAPRTDWHFDRRPLFLISIPKAGTHLLYELARAMGYHAGVELPDVPRPGTWYCLECTNSHTSAAEFFTDGVRRARFGNRHHPFPWSPALFIYRHPLDILVSEAHYYHRDGKTVFGGVLRDRDFAGRIDWLLSDNGVIGPLAQRLESFAPWLDFPNVIPLSFEELVGAPGGGRDDLQRDLVWSIQLRLQAPGVTSDIVGQVFNRESATFRRGEIGTFRTELPAPVLARVAPELRDILERFGYDPAGEDVWPDRAREYRSRVPRFATSDFTNMPMQLEEGFLGCNLVLYRRRYFGVPIAAGPLAVDRLPAAELERLPWADSLSELKVILLLGLADYRDRFEALRRAGQMLAGHRGDVEADRYWSDRRGPAIVEIRSDFNIVALHGRYIGLRRSLGPVDLSAPLEALMHRYAPGDFLVSSSLHAIRDEIDGVALSARLAHTLVAPKGSDADVGRMLEFIDRRLSELENLVRALRRREDGVGDGCATARTDGDNPPREAT